MGPGTAAPEVAICTAVWRRHALARLWWAGATRLARRFATHGIRTRLIAAGSEPAHARLARAHGAMWCRVANAPLGRKWNAAAETACLAGADYLLILGSDDFLSDALVDRYAALLRAGWLYVGLSGIYFYEPASGRLALYQLRRKGQTRYGAPIGAGRLLSTRLLQTTNGRPWQDGLNRRLDASMTRTALLPPARLLRVGPGCEAVDVKTAANLWTFDVLHERYPRLRLRPGPLRDIPEWPGFAALATG